ncbi:MAG TPA: histidine phosphatase family protein [Gaiellaceae bacterium]|nr:histidine phosphatase family protein [Gaiellaceae bacterium]
MEIVLVRHGPAGHLDPSRWPDDTERPLSDVDRTRAATAGLVRFLPSLDAVLASSYARAWQTAELLHEAGWPEPERLKELEAGVPAIAVVGLLRGRTEQSLALVGHEPQLSRLASLLCTGDEHALTLDLKKAGAVGLEDKALRWVLPPRALRFLA